MPELTAAADEYDVGQEVELRVTCRDAAGALADPTEVAVYVLPPSGVVVVYRLSLNEVVRESLGVYRVRVTPEEPDDRDSGTPWRWGVRLTGDLVAAGQGFFRVRGWPFE